MSTRALPNDKPKQLRQTTLGEVAANKTKWAISDEKSVALDQSLAELIAFDEMPFSILERLCFTRFVYRLEPWYQQPTRTFISENLIPTMYRRVKKRIVDFMIISSDELMDVNSNLFYCLFFLRDFYDSVISLIFVML